MARLHFEHGEGQGSDTVLNIYDPGLDSISPWLGGEGWNDGAAENDEGGIIFFCDYCATAPPTLMHCGRCKVAQYCSKEWWAFSIPR
jgi:hypothetical protein